MGGIAALSGQSRNGIFQVGHPIKALDAATLAKNRCAQ